MRLSAVKRHSGEGYEHERQPPGVDPSLSRNGVPVHTASKSQSFKATDVLKTNTLSGTYSKPAVLNTTP